LLVVSKETLNLPRYYRLSATWSSSAPPSAYLCRGWSRSMSLSSRRR